MVAAPVPPVRKDGAAPGITCSPYKNWRNIMKRITILFVMMTVFLFCAGEKATLQKPETETQEKEAVSTLPAQEAAEVFPDERKTETERIDPSLISFETIYFDYDRSDIRSESRDILAEHARLMKTYPEIRLLIEGHCDERGTIEYNLALGERRAQAVKTYLVNSGISAGRLLTISYGKERPLDPAHHDQAWSKNRRAQFRQTN